MWKANEIKNFIANITFHSHRLVRSGNKANIPFFFLMYYIGIGKKDLEGSLVISAL